MSFERPNILFQFFDLLQHIIVAFFHYLHTMLFFCLTFLAGITPTLLSETVDTLQGGITSALFSVSTINVLRDSTSPYYPNDFFRNTAIDSSCLYSLVSSNLVQVNSKINLTEPLELFANYSFSVGQQYTLVYISLNSETAKIVFTSHRNNQLKHMVFELGQTCNIGSLLATVGDLSTSSAPLKVFIKEDLIYTYFQKTSGQDSLYITNITSNSSYSLSMPAAKCQISVSPDLTKAIVWQTNSRTHIYQVAKGFNLTWNYQGAVNNFNGYTNTIPISSDSTLALIETGPVFPVRVLDLTSQTVIANITANEGIYSLAFLDSGNRFVFLQTSVGNKVYDMELQSLQSFRGQFGSRQIESDPESGLVYSFKSNSIQCFGVNLTEGNRTISSYPPQVIIYNRQGHYSTFDDNQDESVDPRQFYIEVNLSHAQSQTLSWLNEPALLLNQVIQHTFSSLFSSPFAVFFLSLFNYFTLSSLYVLINVRIPEILFTHLAMLLKACSADILTEVGVQFQASPFSDEKVVSGRARYFSLSSDFITSNYMTLALLLANVILYQMLTFACRCSVKLIKVQRTLVYFRLNCYWGLLASNIIPLLIAWNYNFAEGQLNLPSKLNLGAQYLILILIPFLLVASLLHELNNSRKKGKLQIRVALSEWWCGYQNFIYPLFLLFGDPLYFMTVVGITIAIYLYNSFYSSACKVLAVLKALYPAIFHSCFFVFMFSTDNNILGFTTLICLFSFLIGSLHHILQTVITFIKFICTFIKNNCQTDSEIDDLVTTRSRIRKTRIERIKQPPNVKFDQKTLKVKKAADIKEIIQKVSEHLGVKTNNRIPDESSSVAEQLNSKKRKYKTGKRPKVTKDRKQGSQLVINFNCKGSSICR